MTEDDSEKRMTAPLLRRYVEDKALNGYYLTEKEDVELFEQIESIIRELPPSEKNLDYRRLWISIPRGPIEDYGNFDDGYWESYEEFEDSWRYHHPDDKDWYVFHYEKTSRGERFIAVDGLVLFHDDADRSFRKQSHYHTELLRWLVSIVRDQVNSVKAGTYRDTVLNELPIGYRKGVVKRSDIWESRYWTRKTDMDGTTSKDIEGFSKIVEAGVNEIPKHRLDSMTLNDYLGLCSMCFRIRGEDISGMTLKEQFKRFADGRDDGLLEIYPDDPDAFTEFCRTSNSGHVWEIRSGHGWSWMHLFPRYDDGGWYLELSGCFDRTDFIHIALALYAKGLPLQVRDAVKVLRALRGEDYIGIVPRGEWPFYAQYRFEKYDVLDCITFKDELYEKLKDKIEWYDVNTFYPVEEVQP